MKWILITHREIARASLWSPASFPSFCFPFGNPIKQFSFIFVPVAIDFIGVAERFAQARNFNDYFFVFARWNGSAHWKHSRRNPIEMLSVRECFQSLLQLFTFLDFHFNASHMFIRYQMICSLVKPVFFVQMCVKIAQVCRFGMKSVFARPDDRKHNQIKCQTCTESFLWNSKIVGEAFCSRFILRTKLFSTEF